jgi:uncharacterized membrane protein YoaK (UPF0700 family)
MIAGNFRQAIEGMFTLLSGQRGLRRRPCIFAGLCVTFGIGAATGAFATKYTPDFALAFPVVALMMVLCFGATRFDEERQ